jgi:hypothetical protein
VRKASTLAHHSRLKFGFSTLRGSSVADYRRHCSAACVLTRHSAAQSLTTLRHVGSKFSPLFGLGPGWCPGTKGPRNRF